jgi:hypothetical protein
MVKTTVAHKCNAQIYFKRTNISQNTQINLASVQMDLLFVVALPMRRLHMIDRCQPLTTMFEDLRQNAGIRNGMLRGT